jgi:hypothetical protein
MWTKKWSCVHKIRAADHELAIDCFTSEIYTIFSYLWYEKADIAYCVFNMAIPFKESTERKF